MRAKIALAFGLLAAPQACNKDVEFSSRSADLTQPKVVVDQEFKAGVIGDGHVAFNPLYGSVDERVTLREKPTVKATQKQIVRKINVDEFVQGHDGAMAQEEFVLSRAGKLDLLVVVDNSGSMAEEQQALATKLTSLTKYLKTIDWQIGVITTDSETLRNGGNPIKATDADVDQKFFNAVSVGINGSGNESGIKYAIEALKDCTDETKTWLRKDASFAVFFLSDEDNHSNQPAKLITRMNECRQAALLKAYAMTWETGCPREPGGSETEGLAYIEVVKAFGGTHESICQADYGPTLERISADVARIVQREFTLKYLPVAGSITIEVDGKAYTDFSMDGYRLKLNNADGTLARLKVSYRHDPMARFDRVHLNGTAADGTLAVSVDGTELPAGKFSYDTQTGDVFFVDMPADGVSVKARYRVGGALAKDFNFAAGPAGEVLNVTVDGQAVEGWVMDPATRILTLPEAPVDGADVQIEVRQPASHITRYQMGADQDGPKVLDVTAVVSATGETVAVEIQGSELVFDEADVVDGKEVLVTYNYGDAGTMMTHELPNSPIDGTVQVKGTGEQNCIDNVNVADKVVTFSCNADELSGVEIDYKYVAQRYVSFPVQGGIPDGNNAQVQVYVDGSAIRGWRQENDTIIVDEQELGVESVVRVIVTVFVPAS